MLALLAVSRRVGLQRIAQKELLSNLKSLSSLASSAAPTSDDDDVEETQRRRRRTVSEASTSNTPPIPIPLQRTLRVAVLGVPNAGKSTLVNSLTGAKVSAVSPKTNTTAVPCLGAFTTGDAQILLLDTPGAVSVKEARGPSHARRIRGAWSSSEGTAIDAALFVVDAARQASRPDKRVTALASALAAASRAAEAKRSAERAARELEEAEKRGDEVDSASLRRKAEESAARASEAADAAASAASTGAGFGASPPPGWDPPQEIILVLNKIDAIDPGKTEWLEDKEEALARVAESLVAAATKIGGGEEQGEEPLSSFFSAIHSLSASRPNSRGVRKLADDLAARALPGKPWPLSPDDVSDRPARALALEIVREKTFLRLRKELPYSIEVVETGWRDRGRGDGRGASRKRNEVEKSIGDVDDDGLLSGSFSSSIQLDDTGSNAKQHEEDQVDFENPGSVVAEYDLIVSREPVRRMVVGRGGCVVGEIGVSARRELERLLDKKVHLYLTVRVGGKKGGRK